MTAHNGAYVASRAAIGKNKRFYAGKDVIFLVRDPRDTLISYYFQASRRRDHFVGTPSEFFSEDDVAYMNTRIAERLSPFYADYLQPR